MAVSEKRDEKGGQGDLQKQEMKGGGNNECSHSVGLDERAEEGALMGSSGGGGRYLKGKALHRQNITYSQSLLHMQEPD